MGTVASTCVDSELPAPAPKQPSRTYAQVLIILDAAGDLSPGVRNNQKGAVIKIAKLMSPAGIEAVVNVPAIAEQLGKLTPAQLSFKHKGSLAVFKSNLIRALRLAGFTITPSRHITPLSPAWAALQARISDFRIRRPLTRFMHIASEKRWNPDDICPAHLGRFREILTTTCLKSKVDNTVRNTVRAWNTAVQSIAGWPQHRLETGRGERFYVLPWNDFPASYREDVEAFLDRGEDDWLDGDAGRLPVKPATKSNYREALRRAASILVKLGADRNSIKTLADVTHPIRVRLILNFLRERTGRQNGGHVGYIALLLYMAARDHVRPSESDLAELGKFVRNTAERQRGMSDKTWERLVQFEDPEALNRLEELPEDLAKSVVSRPVTIATGKMVRLALALALIWDTGLRSGNVVALDLDRHVIGGETSGVGTINLFIPHYEVKNGSEFRGPLTGRTTRLWKLYVQKYRRIHTGKASTWLFPRPDGSHWSQPQVYRDLKDVTEKLLGLDVNPHLIRALIGKIILDEYPGGHAIAQQVLQHKQLTTTVAYYAPMKPTEARAIYHEILEKRNAP